MSLDNSEPVRVPRNVFDGLEAVRQSGVTNMFDTNAVGAFALAFGYAATYEWLLERKNARLLVRGVFHGVEPDDALPDFEVAEIYDEVVFG